jgi:hypothetical protein
MKTYQRFDRTVLERLHAVAAEHRAVAGLPDDAPVVVYACAAEAGAPLTDPAIRVAYDPARAGVLQPRVYRVVAAAEGQAA